MNDTKEFVSTYLKNAEQRGLSKETIRWYSGYLQKFGDTYPELPMLPEPLEEFIAGFTSGDERRHGSYRCLRAFYGFISNRHDLANPMAKVRPPRRGNKEKAALSIEQLRTLLECNDIKPWVKTLIFLLSDNGIRIGEVPGITRDDVYEDTVKVTGKTKERIVPISPMVRGRLLDLPGHTLFPYSKDWLRHSVKKALNQAGLKGSPHLLRHTFATLFDGSDLALKDILGHSTFHMVNQYRHKKTARAVAEHKEHSPLTKLFSPDELKEIYGHIQDNGEPIPESLSLTSKTDDISAMLQAFPYKDCGHHLASAKFYYHATLYNAARQLLNAVESHVRESTIQKYMIEDLYEMVTLDGDVDCEDSPGDIVKAMQSEAKKIWQMELSFLEGFLAEQHSKALTYKRMAGDTISITEVSVLEPACYSFSISN